MGVCKCTTHGRPGWLPGSGFVRLRPLDAPPGAVRTGVQTRPLPEVQVAHNAADGLGRESVDSKAGEKKTGQPGGAATTTSVCTWFTAAALTSTASKQGPKREEVVR